MDIRPENKASECANCGAVLEAHSSYCGLCGAEIPAAAIRPLSAMAWAGQSSYRIPVRRIVIMTFLTQGLYLIYWLFRTRKHYLEHISAGSDPKNVPYSMSSIYSHIQSLRELMEAAGITMSISLGTTYLLVITYLLMFVIGSLMNGDFLLWGPVTQWAPVVSVPVKFFGHQSHGTRI